MMLARWVMPVLCFSMVSLVSTADSVKDISIHPPFQYKQFSKLNDPLLCSAYHRSTAEREQVEGYRAFRRLMRDDSLLIFNVAKPMCLVSYFERKAFNESAWGLVFNVFNQRKNGQYGIKFSNGRIMLLRTRLILGALSSRPTNIAFINPIPGTDKDRAQNDYSHSELGLEAVHQSYDMVVPSEKKRYKGKILNRHVKIQTFQGGDFEGVEFYLGEFIDALKESFRLPDTGMMKVRFFTHNAKTGQRTPEPAVRIGYLVTRQNDKPTNFDLKNEAHWIWSDPVDMK